MNINYLSGLNFIIFFPLNHVLEQFFDRALKDLSRLHTVLLTGLSQLRIKMKRNRSNEVANIVAVIGERADISHNKFSEAFAQQGIDIGVAYVLAHKRGKRSQKYIWCGSLVYVLNDNLFVEPIFRFKCLP